MRACTLLLLLTLSRTVLADLPGEPYPDLKESLGDADELSAVLQLWRDTSPLPAGELRPSCADGRDPAQASARGWALPIIAGGMATGFWLQRRRRGHGQ